MSSSRIKKLQEEYIQKINRSKEEHRDGTFDVNLNGLRYKLRFIIAELSKVEILSDDALNEYVQASIADINNRLFEAGTRCLGSNYNHDSPKRVEEELDNILCDLAPVVRELRRFHITNLLAYIEAGFTYSLLSKEVEYLIKSCSPIIEELSNDRFVHFSISNFVDSERAHNI